MCHTWDMTGSKLERATQGRGAPIHTGALQPCHINEAFCPIREAIIGLSVKCTTFTWTAITTEWRNRFCMPSSWFISRFLQSGFWLFITHHFPERDHDEHQRRSYFFVPFRCSWELYGDIAGWREPNNHDGGQDRCSARSGNRLVPIPLCSLIQKARGPQASQLKQRCSSDWMFVDAHIRIAC